MRAHAIDAIHASDAGFPSDTSLLVDACVATVRQAARLDDDAVLPPLPKVAPRRDVVIFTKSETASVRGSADEVVDVTDLAILEDDESVARPARSSRSRSRWALVLCAVVASAFGAAAFLGSPAGQPFARRHGPALNHATTSARAHASAAAHATVALFTR